ncbi:hypothetical protein [Aminobacter niigataensis]|uniref:hypothetical protein n=1 Tax=Aminobacter niigataensis TaxID=83265 RepID=UPI0024CB48C8|nr:hypothetical protein [Aminobacter niigataensis]CAI2931890.1 protein of unknown function [Aminobacter niigataensis]
MPVIDFKTRRALTSQEPELPTECDWTFNHAQHPEHRDMVQITLLVEKNALAALDQAYAQAWVDYIVRGRSQAHVEQQVG